MEYVGPFEREPFPERLTAMVVDPRGEPRIHGYDVRADLGRYHGFADVAWLALRGELPRETEREAFSVAMTWLAPVHAGEAPAHATILARLIAAAPSAVVSVAATGLAEQGRSERELLAPWLAWLVAPSGPPPRCAYDSAPTAAAAEAQAWLAAASARWFGAAAALPVEPVLSRLALAHALLHLLGLRGAQQVEAVVVWARLLTVVAESASVRGGAVRLYPARLPDYQYVDDEGSAP